MPTHTIAGYLRLPWHTPAHALIKGIYPLTAGDLCIAVQINADSVAFRARGSAILGSDSPQ